MVPSEVWCSLAEHEQQFIISIFKSHGADFEAMFIVRESEQSCDSPPSPLEDWLTRKEAAAYLKVSPDTIDNLCAKGYIEKIKLGGGKAGTVRISRKSLDAFIKSRIVNRPKRVRHDLAPSVPYRAH